MNIFITIRHICVLLTVEWLEKLLLNNNAISINFGLIPTVSKKINQNDYFLLEPIFKEETFLLSFSNYITFATFLWFQTKFYYVTIFNSTTKSLLLVLGSFFIIYMLYLFFTKSRTVKCFKRKITEKKSFLDGCGRVEFVSKVGLYYCNSYINSIPSLFLRIFNIKIYKYEH